MEFPSSFITSTGPQIDSSPAWPKKRKFSDFVYGPIKIGPGLETDGQNLQVSAGEGLTFTAPQNSLSVIPALAQPYRSNEIFTPGDLQSGNFRIPALLALSNGSLLLACDVRFDTIDDFHKVSIGVAISKDDGTSWCYRGIVLEPEDRSAKSRYLDPCVVEDGTGTIHLFAVYFEGEQHLRIKDDNYDFVHTISKDGGYTWSAPESFKHFRAENEKYFFQSPGIGIVTTNGTIVVPCQGWLDVDVKDSSLRKYLSTIIYSRDGITWERATGDSGSNTSESQVAEYPEPEKLIMICRDEVVGGVSPEARTVVVSDDFGKTWTSHRTSLTLRMRSPCFGSLLRITAPDGAWTLLFSSPLTHTTNVRDSRKNIVLQMFNEDMAEWEPVGIIYKKQTVGYSTLAVSKRYNRLLCSIELPVAVQRSAIYMFDISRFFSFLTPVLDSDVNLGYSVTVNNEACSLPSTTDRLKCRYSGGSYWLAGKLLPPKSGLFPSEKATTLFQFDVRDGLSSVGFLPVYGSLSTELNQVGYSVFTFILQYTVLNNVCVVSTFAESSLPSGNSKLSAMKVLFIPDSRIGVMC